MEISTVYEISNSFLPKDIVNYIIIPYVFPKCRKCFNYLESKDGEWLCDKCKWAILLCSKCVFKGGPDGFNGNCSQLFKDYGLGEDFVNWIKKNSKEIYSE